MVYDGFSDYERPLQAIFASVHAGVEFMRLRGPSSWSPSCVYSNLFTRLQPHLRKVTIVDCVQLAVCLPELLAHAPTLDSLELESIGAGGNPFLRNKNALHSQLVELLASRSRCSRLRGSVGAPLKYLAISELNHTWVRAILTGAKVFAAEVDVSLGKGETAENRDQQWAALEYLGQSQQPTSLILRAYRSEEATLAALRKRLISKWTAAGVRVSAVGDAVIKLEGQAA